MPKVVDPSCHGSWCIDSFNIIYWFPGSLEECCGVSLGVSCHVVLDFDCDHGFHCSCVSIILTIQFIISVTISNYSYFLMNQRISMIYCKGRFIITNSGSGHAVNGLRYKEYHLQDYSPWFLKQLNDSKHWRHLRSCLVKSEECNSLPKRFKTLKEYKLAELTPIEAGCCRPPSECGYPAVNASYYDLSYHPVSKNKDCKLYKNARSIKCYDCDSCKAGVAQYMKMEWRIVAIFNVILFVVLSFVYFIGCCARRNVSRIHTPKIPRRR
ncbi:tetraspanin-10-like isoform X2 [Zingiber officinale]|uniref:tetraspanin-10-like isoform X2 n=1 Tax=Zingiber officinale TaxID=94328 RepID=UPI001C4C32E2|nr:tetraspanin-10-like isoform X2 [Zingiber officinale]XP_042419497.1 tetraspanin-10-like isoform X2 [Zingiber officinale]XP_042431269.1 tetraspanin-10-like isoform X2 [Zingiber officinale]